MTSYLSKYDTARFGFPIARAHCEDPEQASDAMNSASLESAELLILRFPAEATSFGRWLHDLPNRWTFADTLVYYRRPVEDEIPIHTQDGLRARLGVGSDAQRVGSMAAATFEGYASHYSWGPRTADPSKLAAGYGEWASRLTQGEQGFAYLIEDGDASLVAFACSALHSESIADTPLAGVARPFQRLGLYGWLMAGTYAELRRRRVQEHEVSTQVHNLAVQKVWLRQGFLLHRAVQTVHVDLRGRRF